MALALSVLMSLAVGAASQGPVMDPTSTAQQMPGYAGQQAATAVNGLATAVNGMAGAVNGAVNAAPPATGGGFVNPANIQAAGPVNANQGGIAQLANAAINGDPAAQKQAQAAAIAEAPTAGGRFMDGVIKGYLEKTTLMAGEKTCIRNEVHKMAKDGIGLLTGLATVISQLTAQDNPDALALMAGAGQAVELGTAAQTLVKTCIKSDSQAVVQVTLEHLKDPQYVQSRMMANALEIVGCLADSVKKAGIGRASGKDHWTEVGADFGRVMRKALLSDDHQAMQLFVPAGVAQTSIGPQIMQGVVEGMFVEGSQVQITSKTNLGIEIFIDLHRCVAKEAKYVTTAMGAVYVAMSQMMAQINQATLAAKGVQTGLVQPQVGLGGTSQWMNELKPLMTNIPTLMDRCGITTTQKDDMLAALKDVKDLKAAFTIPGPGLAAAATKQASKRLADATKFWEMCTVAGKTETCTLATYTNFGMETGGLLRDLLLSVMPAVETGAAALPAQALWEEAHLDDAKNPAGSFALYVGGFAAVALLGLTLLRVRSQTQEDHKPALLQQDEEDIE